MLEVRSKNMQFCKSVKKTFDILFLWNTYKSSRRNVASSYHVTNFFPTCKFRTARRTKKTVSINADNVHLVVSCSKFRQVLMYQACFQNTPQ